MSVQGKLSPGADRNINNLSEGSDEEGADDDDDWDVHSTTRGDSVHLAGVMRKLLDLQGECRAKRQRVPTNVARAV